MNLGSGGPAVDQNGRCENPLYFAAGNILRPVETGGWSFREGRAIGRAIADDLRRSPSDASPIKVTHDDPIKLVVPNLLRRGTTPTPGFDRFQLRFLRPCQGVLSLDMDGREVFRASVKWHPERRVLVPMPADAAYADRLHFTLSERV